MRKELDENEEENLVLTKEENNAVRALERLAKRWPDSLWLFSAAGTLCVMKKDKNGNRVEMTGSYRKGAVDEQYIVATINIENDGGDW